LKNYKAQKHSREEQSRGHASVAKKVKVDKNDVVEKVSVNVVNEVHENADVIEKEGTAISVLLCLSKL
jgi:hypothetical protein